MSTHKQRTELVRQLAKTITTTLTVKEDYENVKDTLQGIIYKVFAENDAFIYFQPKTFEEFTLAPLQHLDLADFNLEKKETVELFKNLVSFFFKRRWDVIISSSRKREVVQARQLTAEWLSRNTTWSLKKIGKFIGGTDHSTVIHTKNIVKDLCDVDRTFMNLYTNFNQLLDVYIESNITGGLGETIAESGTGITENRSVCSTEEN